MDSPIPFARPDVGEEEADAVREASEAQVDRVIESVTSVMTGRRHRTG